MRVAVGVPSELTPPWVIIDAARKLDLARELLGLVCCPLSIIPA